MVLLRAAPLLLLLALSACSADVTGLRIRFEHDTFDVRQYVVRVTDAGGNVIHECTAPATPAPEGLLSGESWTVLFDDGRAGEVRIEALAIDAGGQQILRGFADYYMDSLEIARPSILMTGNLRDVVLPPACAVAADDTLPPWTPRGSLVTVDERGTFFPGTDAAATDAGP